MVTIVAIFLGGNLERERVGQTALIRSASVAVGVGLGTLVCLLETLCPLVLLL